MGFNYNLLSPAAQGTADYISTQYGITPTSGHRTEAHNEHVGGAKHSEHLTGNAIDIPTVGMTEDQIYALIEDLKSRGIGGIGVYDGSLHFDHGAAGRIWGPDYTSKSAPLRLKELMAHAGGGEHPAQQGVGDDRVEPEAPPPPLWAMMDKDEETGDYGETAAGMMRVPGTGITLNSGGVGGALMHLGGALRGRT